MKVKVMVVLVLALGTGCAHILGHGTDHGGQQSLRVQNEEASVDARGWTTGQEIPTIITHSASATTQVTDANTRADVNRVAVRTDDYVERRGADLPHAALAAQTSEREGLTEGLRLQQAACAARFADGHESVTCMVLNQQVVAVLNGGQGGYYLPYGGSWMGGGGNYSVSAIRTAAAIEAARRFRDARRTGVTPYGASNAPGEAVDSEARGAVRELSDDQRALRGVVRRHIQPGAASAQQGGGQ